MMEAAVVLDRNWRPLYFHMPPGRTEGSLPDSPELWEVLWSHRDRLLGVAHSHPGGGVPSPSRTDVTTFAAIEAGFGSRLIWPIVTVDAFRAFVWVGPERLDYGVWPASLTVDMLALWAPELLKQTNEQ